MAERTFAARLRRAVTPRHPCIVACSFAIGAVAWAAGIPAAQPDGHGWPSVIPQVAAQTAANGPAGFADVVERVKPAVIGVRAKVTNVAARQQPDPVDGFFREFGNREFGNSDEGPSGQPGAHRMLTSLGSGFFISADGYAVTNNHVVEGSDVVEIQTDDQKTHTAKVVGNDPTSDLALLKVEGNGRFSYVRLADKLPRVGDWILAIGNPFGLGGTVTAGIVSARERNIGTSFDQDLLQIDAPINRGDSGGPSFDLAGNVVGVNTMIVSPTGGSIGIAFAIPADTVRSVVAQLKQTGTVRRGWMGVQIQPVTADIADTLGLAKAQGALIAEAEPQSPSAKAGLASGDVVVSVNGEPTKDARELSRKLGNMLPGTAVRLGILRRNAEKTITVRLGERPSQPKAPSPKRESSRSSADLGLQLAPTNGQRSGQANGVLITDIDPQGLAASSGCEAVDVILDVGGKAVRMPADVHTAFREARNQGKRRVLVRLKSGDTTHFVAVSVDPT
jgi:serine protease Do